MPITCETGRRTCLPVYPSQHEMYFQVRLNERNVVELINKLNELGFLGDGLLHTVIGREYVTPEHLRKEIVETVEQAGGRMSLVRKYTTCFTTSVQHWQCT